MASRTCNTGTGYGLCAVIPHKAQAMQQTATFIFHDGLLDFLKPSVRQQPVKYTFGGKPAIKDAIEALGVPHPEVALVLSGGAPLKFNDRLYGQDEIHVYSYSSALCQVKEGTLIPKPPVPIKFVLDVHLGSLAKMLRMLGFDTLYQKNLDDAQIAHLAHTQNRIVLTRDVGLLKHKVIVHGYWLRSQYTQEQLQEVLNRYNLAAFFTPFNRCLLCNAIIESAPKEVIMHKIPPKTQQYFDEFFHCVTCDKVYWKGSHYEHMLSVIKGIRHTQNTG